MNVPEHADVDEERMPDGWEDDGIVYTAGGNYTRTFFHPDREIRITYDLHEDMGSGPLGVEYFDPTTAEEACWGHYHGRVTEIDDENLPDVDPHDDESYLEFCYAVMEAVERLDISR